MNCDLHPVAVAEGYGLIFVRASGLASIDVDATLGGAQDDLGSYGLDHYTHFETRSALWKMNWKLVLDTFTESYHIRTLHKTTLAPTFHSGCVLFEPFGGNVASSHRWCISTVRSTRPLMARPERISTSRY